MVGWATASRPTPPKLHYYCDASSHRGHQFMVAGGIAATPERAAAVEVQINELKEDAGMTGRFHWSDYRGGGRRDAYFGLVDLFFDLTKEQKLHSHFIICEFADFTHKFEGKPGTPERSVNRMYYQLFLRRLCKFYGKTHALHVFPDHGGDSAEVVQFRGAICANAYRSHKTMPNCLRSITPTSSADCPMIQMIDVIIGGMAAHREGRNLVGPKRELMDHIIDQSPRTSWAHDTSPDYRIFNVWNFQHRR